MPDPTPSRTETRDILAFYGALCLVLATLEYLFPKPIPFMRLGLANLPILLALRTFDTREVLLLAVLKVLGQGLVGGTLFSYVFLFSAAGSFAATLAMVGAARLGSGRISYIGISVLGALSSNVVQVLLAVALIFGTGGWLIGPPFLAVGTVSGVLLGVFAEAFDRGSQWLSAIRAVLAGKPSGSAPAPAPDPPGQRRPRRIRRRGPDRVGHLLSRRGAFVAGVAALPAFLFVERVELLTPLVALYLVLMLLSGRSFRPMFPVVAAIGVITANLLMPQGRVLLSLGGVTITAGALEQGLRKTLTYIGLVYLSYVAVRPGLRLPGRFGGLFARVIVFFERLLEAQKPFDRRHPLASLDRFLWSTFPPGVSEPLPASPAASAGSGRFNVSAAATRTRGPGWVVAATVALPPWGALVYQLLAGR